MLTSVATASSLGARRPSLAVQHARSRLVVRATALNEPSMPISGAEKPMWKKQQTWVATITSTAPEKDGYTAEQLELTVVDQATGQRSQTTVVDDSWEKFRAGGSLTGWARKGLVRVPADFKAPAAVLVKKGGEKGSKDYQDYISALSLATLESEYDFPVHSWVAPEHETRSFFAATFLPKDTPQAVQQLRREELEKLQGEDGPQLLSDTDRAYGYQRYDDLGEGRPALGLASGDAAEEVEESFPYPRHIANNGTPFEGPGKQWLPLDERFDDSKTRGFNGNLLGGILPAFNTVLPKLLKGGKFGSYEDVLKFFSDKPHDGGSSLDDGDSESADWDVKVDGAFESVTQGSDEDPEDNRFFLWRLLNPKTSRAGPSVKDLFKFRSPRVLVGRGLDVIETDEEWGRQAIAGMNPCTLVALTKLPAEQYGSAIGAQHVDVELKKLGGSSLTELVAQAAAGGKPRLFMIDYMVLDHFWGKKAEDDKDRTEHAGRALLFLKHNDQGEEEALLPIAFELKHRKTAQLEAAEGRKLAAGQGVVYARQELVGNAANPGGEALWAVAKAVFRSLDSGYHQLVSHWLRCHACLEPFAIALHRQLSTIHPVYRLMLPHFRYTLDINSKARASLVNANGIIERCFTPGEFSMRLSAIAYAGWRFKTQALPEDLAARGMLDKDGNIWLQDYPYAQDGLELWEELEAYFTEYLSIYYKSPEDVEGDEELQKWWREVKEKGHPDMAKIEPDEEKVWGFKGDIQSVGQLVRVLTTIAFTASAHHASVNFGQFDFASLMLNVSSVIRRPIPRPTARIVGNEAEKMALDALTTSKDKKLEAELLTYVADPITAVQVMVTIKLLSIHAENEHTLDERNSRLTDPEAVEANQRFCKRMQAMEARFQTRNNSPDKWTRYTGTDGERKEAMRYTLLLPPSQEGLTFKGVPYSVSI